MTIREALENYLRALKERDLPALAALLPEDELTQILADGRIVRSVDDFLSRHRDWFASACWSIETRLEELTESEALGLATVHVCYRDALSDSERPLERGYLTLAFARHGEQWVMIHSQITPIRPLPS